MLAIQVAEWWNPEAEFLQILVRASDSLGVRNAWVTSNTRLADLKLAVDRLDDRRLEVVANGLPLWGGARR